MQARNGNFVGKKERIGKIWQLLFQDEYERKKREEIMREIYEMDRRNKKKECDLDKNTTMGYGLLAEMSLNELEQRLEQVKKEQLEEEER